MGGVVGEGAVEVGAEGEDARGGEEVGSVEGLGAAGVEGGEEGGGGAGGELVGVSGAVEVEEGAVVGVAEHGGPGVVVAIEEGVIGAFEVSVGIVDLECCCGIGL